MTADYPDVVYSTGWIHVKTFASQFSRGLEGGASTCRSPTWNRVQLAAEFFTVHNESSKKSHLIAAQVENGRPYSVPVLSNGPSFISGGLLRSHLKFILCNSSQIFSTGRPLYTNPRGHRRFTMDRGLSRR